MHCFKILNTLYLHAITVGLLMGGRLHIVIILIIFVSLSLGGLEMTPIKAVLLVWL